MREILLNNKSFTKGGVPRIILLGASIFLIVLEAVDGWIVLFVGVMLNWMVDEAKSSNGLRELASLHLHAMNADRG
jgi:hypothetical protein